MTVYDTPASRCHMAGAKVLPVRIDGAQVKPVRPDEGPRPSLFPKNHAHRVATGGIRGGRSEGQALRGQLTTRLLDTMTGMVFATSPIHEHLFASLLVAVRRHGRGAAVVEDIQRNPLTYGRYSRVLRSRQRPRAMTGGERTVGVLLPNARGDAGERSSADGAWPGGGDAQLLNRRREHGRSLPRRAGEGRSSPRASSSNRRDGRRPRAARRGSPHRLPRGRPG